MFAVPGDNVTGYNVQLLLLPLHLHLHCIKLLFLKWYKTPHSARIYQFFGWKNCPSKSATEALGEYIGQKRQLGTNFGAEKMKKIFKFCALRFKEHPSHWLLWSKLGVLDFEFAINHGFISDNQISYNHSSVPPSNQYNRYIHKLIRCYTRKLKTAAIKCWQKQLSRSPCSRIPVITSGTGQVANQKYLNFTNLPLQ